MGYISDVYDLFGVQHLGQLRAARAECDFLIVGVLADDIATDTTGKAPVTPFAERLAIARSMRGVDVAIGQLTGDLVEVWQQLRFDRLLVPAAAAVDPAHGELREMGVEIVHLTAGQDSADGPIRDSSAPAVPTSAHPG